MYAIPKFQYVLHVFSGIYFEGLGIDAKYTQHG